MAQHCARAYCCPHMVSIISEEATDLFEEMMRNRAVFHATTVDERTLRNLALTRTASKHGAVKRLVKSTQ